MKVLITGAGGFIGSHLVEAALEAGHDVRAFVHYNSAGSAGWLDTLEAKAHVETVRGDIRDMDGVSRALDGCEGVFHLAALIGIPYSYVSPLAYIQTNIVGTYNVLEAARALGTREILITSTSETYGTARYVPIDEAHPCLGQSPYSASKIGADQLALSYFLSFGLPVKLVRPFNTYGPRQSTRAVIPTIISQLLLGDGTVKLGNLDPTRDLTHVKDTARGFLAIHGCPGLVGQATNIGMDEETSVRDLVHLVGEILGKPARIEEESGRRRREGSEVERLRCDRRRLVEATGWRPEHTLRTGLEDTIRWFEEHGSRHAVREYHV